MSLDACIRDSRNRSELGWVAQSEAGRDVRSETVGVDALQMNASKLLPDRGECLLSCGSELVRDRTDDCQGLGPSADRLRRYGRLRPSRSCNDADEPSRENHKTLHPPSPRILRPG